MKVLITGDCVGRPGRRIIEEQTALLRNQHSIDLVVANVENASGGFSITRQAATSLFEAGVDVMTSGNHIFDNKEVLDFIQREPRLLRPINYVPGVPGTGVWTGVAGGATVAVINLQGRVFMPPCDDPFRAIDSALAALNPAIRTIIVDVHAETTAEKMAIGRYLDGRVSVVAGTHTHVATADDQILPGGTAYITDLGMTGPHAGVIGMQTPLVLERFTTGLNVRFDVCDGDVQLNGILVEIDDTSGRAISVARLRVPEAQ